MATAPWMSLASSPAPAAAGASACRVQVSANYGNLPLHFIANQGQVDRQVRFYARRGASTFFFTRKGLVLTLPEEVSGWSKAARRRAAAPDPEPAKRRRIAVRLTPVGLAPGVKLEALKPLPGRVNYFIGSDPKKWRTDLPTYRAVVYREAYPGIDLKFYGNGRQLEYDIIVRPGADPSQVKFRCQGVESLKVTPTGDLALKLPGGEKLVQKKPLIYQELGGQRVFRDGRFTLHRDTVGVTFSFALAAYDHMQPLVIDPVLLYSTYLGGFASDTPHDIAVDGAGCAYVTGSTRSTDFPTQSAYQSDQGSMDVFVTKLSAGGNALVYSTYLGGDDDEGGLGIAVDSFGQACVTGYTDSTDFPTRNPYQGNQGGRDAFIVKLGASGNVLLYSTYLGGSANDMGRDIAVNSAGYAFVTGETDSTDFPTWHQYQGDQGGTDAFVTKLGLWAGDTLVYSTYLGGNGDDVGFAIAVDKSGYYAFVTGHTSSTDFPTRFAYQTNQGGMDVFVTKLNAPGDDLVYSTYLGGSDAEEGYSIAVDGNDCVYVTGYTNSTDFPRLNAYQENKQMAWDAFVTKLTRWGSSLVYSTYLGGRWADVGGGIAVDQAGCAYVTGDTDSADFPIHSAYQTDQGARDAFVTKLSPEGNALAFSTYLGGSDSDSGSAIAVDRFGCVYVTGQTSSTDFPTRFAYQTNQRDIDGFVTKLGPPHIPLDLLLQD